MKTYNIILYLQRVKWDNCFVAIAFLGMLAMGNIVLKTVQVGANREEREDCRVMQRRRQEKERDLARRAQALREDGYEGYLFGY